jgi:hypothetical protein
MFKNPRGYARRAKDADIELVTNFFFDIDYAEEISNMQKAELELFLVKTEPYFEDLGVNQPVRAFTGKGYHLLFPVLPIRVADCPDIKERLKWFRADFKDAFQEKMSALEVKIDHTMDLSRFARIYGTRKPTGLQISEFYGDNRVEDAALRDYLLSMDVEPANDALVVCDGELPQKFIDLLEAKDYMKDLWEGTGKTEGDTSESGYDFSLMRQCLKNGITDICDLRSILELRPNGSVQQSGKGDQYIKATIANAIKQ